MSRTVVSRVDGKKVVSRIVRIPVCEYYVMKWIHDDQLHYSISIGTLKPFSQKSCWVVSCRARVLAVAMETTTTPSNCQLPRQRQVRALGVGKHPWQWPVRVPGRFYKRISTCRIAERAHWSLPWKRIAMINPRIPQFCKSQFFYEMSPRGLNPAIIV